VKLLPNTSVEDEAGVFYSPKMVCGKCGLSSMNQCYCSGSDSGHGFFKFSLARLRFSSEAGAKKTTKEEDDDLEEGFSELETPVGEESEKGVVSDSEDSDESDESEIAGSHNELELPLSHDVDEVSTGKRSSRKRADSELFKAIMNGTGPTIHTALEKWVEDGKELSREEISLAMNDFRRRKIYGKALQVT